MAMTAVRIFSTMWEAGMAQSLLEAEGIRAIVEDAIVNSVLPYMPSAFEGVRLLVDESEMERAAKILAEWDASTPLEETEEGDEEPEGDTPGDEEQV